MPKQKLITLYDDEAEYEEDAQVTIEPFTEGSDRSQEELDSVAEYNTSTSAFKVLEPIIKEYVGLVPLSLLSADGCPAECPLQLLTR